MPFAQLLYRAGIPGIALTGGALDADAIHVLPVNGLAQRLSVRESFET
jgi:hypothetical protein